MNWWVWLIAGWTVVLLVCGCLFELWRISKRQRKDKYDDSGLGFAVAAFVVFVLAFGLQWVPLGQAIGNHITAESCRNWGVENHRQAKFVYYTFWNTGCSTIISGGQWIPIGQIGSQQVTLKH